MKNDGAKVALTPAPAASPPAAIAAAITLPTTKFLITGIGFKRGVYPHVSSTEARIVAFHVQLSLTAEDKGGEVGALSYGSVVTRVGLDYRRISLLSGVIRQGRPSQVRMLKQNSEPGESL